MAYDESAIDRVLFLARVLRDFRNALDGQFPLRRNLDEGLDRHSQFPSVVCLFAIDVDPALALTESAPNVFPCRSKGVLDITRS